MAYVILGLLLVKPSSIYDLGKQFERSISLFYSASLGSLRQALLGLLDRGEVRVVEEHTGRRARKIYHVTPLGRAAFTAWMHGPLAGTDFEVAALSRLFFLGHLPASERTGVVEAIVERIRSDEARLVDLADHLDTTPVPDEFAELFRYQRLTLDYGISAHRHARAWFEGIQEAATG